MLEPVSAKMMQTGIANTGKNLDSPFLLLAILSALLLMGAKRKSSSIGEMQFANSSQILVCFFKERFMLMYGGN